MSKMWERADFWPVEPRNSVAAHDYARGLADGRATAEAELASERAAVVQLAGALEMLKPPSSGMLAALMIEAVERLVIDIAGSAPIDAALLRERAAMMATLIAGDTEAVLAAHPDDAVLLEGLPVIADPALMRGTVEARANSGTFEDGVRPALARLRAEIDRLGLAA